MKTLLPRLTSAFPFLAKCSATESGLFSSCEDRGITITTTSGNISTILSS